MAFSTPTYLPIARLKYFIYNATGGSAAATDSTIIEYLTMSHAFELDKIHVKLSSPHASVVDLMIYVSNYLNSYYNKELVSQAMNGVKDILFQADPTLIFESGDTIHMSMIMSAANHYGFEISGWAITQPAAGWK